MPPPPFLTWDTDPKTRTVLATFCCDGPVIEELVHPYIPEAQIWGDGCFFWTERNTDGERQVMVKQLTTDEMNELLDDIEVWYLCLIWPIRLNKPNKAGHYSNNFLLLISWVQSKGKRQQINVLEFFDDYCLMYKNSNIKGDFKTYLRLRLHPFYTAFSYTMACDDHKTRLDIVPEM
jgi:hypothetical protein